MEQELRWTSIDASDIGVAVKDGIVTLTELPKPTHKWQAERDAKRIAGVVGVANDIEVRIPIDRPET